MIFLLSPAKTLDYESPLSDAVSAALGAIAAAATAPVFRAEAAALIAVLRARSVADIAALMALSPALAQLNVDRYKAWSARASAHNSRPALWAFNGDVYEGLQAASFSVDDIGWAQQHVRILSGLYGILRPLDRLQPYRLEMGTALRTERGDSLYAFWQDAVAAHLNQLQARESAPVIVNLASQEYFKVTQARRQGHPVLRARVIDCVFQDWKAGVWKVISFYAKRARGMMARYAIAQRVSEPAQLADFQAEGYALAPRSM